MDLRYLHSKAAFDQGSKAHGKQNTDATTYAR